MGVIGSARMVPGGTSGGGSGTVTNVSGVNANGFTVSPGGSPTTTPAITVGTSVNGVAKGNGTALSAATSGTDYAPGTSANATGLVKSTTGTGALSTAVAWTDYAPPIVLASSSVVYADLASTNFTGFSGATPVSIPALALTLGVGVWMIIVSLNYANEATAGIGCTAALVANTAVLSRLGSSGNAQAAKIKAPTATIGDNEGQLTFTEILAVTTAGTVNVDVWLTGAGSGTPAIVATDISGGSTVQISTVTALRLG